MSFTRLVIYIFVAALPFHSVNFEVDILPIDFKITWFFGILITTSYIFSVSAKGKTYFDKYVKRLFIFVVSAIAISIITYFTKKTYPVYDMISAYSQLLLWFFVLLSTANSIRTRQHLYRLITVWQFVALLVSFYALAEYFGFVDLFDQLYKEKYSRAEKFGEVYRATGVFREPSFLAFYLLGPLLYSYTHTLKKGKNVKHLGFVAIYSFTIILSMSLSAYIALFVTITCGLLFNYTTGNAFLYTAVIIGVSVAAVAGQSGLGSATTERVYTFLRNFDQYGFDVASRGSIGIRLTSLGMGSAVFIENPFIGIGINAFPEYASSVSPNWVASNRIQTVHSLPLLLLAELGMIGLSIYTSFVYMIARDLYRGTFYDIHNNQMNAAVLAALISVTLMASLGMSYVHPYTYLVFSIAVSALRINKS